MLVVFVWKVDDLMISCLRVLCECDERIVPVRARMFSKIFLRSFFNGKV
jgi:hypothetical protein